jgi:1-acyl-sn-glycerol-3-phosphate acyltransferase
VELPNWKVNLIHKSTNYAAWGVCFACGLIFPKFKKLKIKDFDKDYPDYSNRTDRAPVIISNHVSWLDPMLYTSFLKISYLSKAEIGKVPLFGTIGKGT